jgi:hypothetical protein
MPEGENALSHAIRFAIVGIVVLSFRASPQAERTSAAPRVRSENPVLAAAIARGSEQSLTFKRLIADIDATDGLVYVAEGRCGQGVRACLHMTVDLAGPFRMLRVFVNSRRAPGCELIGSIGHELQHAIEALGNPGVRSGFALVSFFRLLGPEGTIRFETPEAIAAGVAVEKETCGRDSRTLRAD